MAFTEEDRLAIAFLRKTKNYGGKRLLKEFPEKEWTLGGLNKLLRKIDATGSAKRRAGSGRKRHVRTAQNIASVEQLIKEKDNPDTPRSLRKISKHLGISRSSVRRIIQKDLTPEKKPKPAKPAVEKKKKSAASTPTTKKYSDTCISTTYNPDQQQQILSVLNKYQRDDLWQFSITKNNATAVVRYRKKHGDFNKLDDVLEVDGFGVSILQKFCDSIVYGINEDAKGQSSQKVQLCYPSISDETRQKLTSVVALHFYGQEVVWVHLNREMVILEWDSMPLTERSRPYNHVTSLQTAREIVGRLPLADVYLLEQRLLRVGARQPTPLPALAGTIQLESMITVLLNQDNNGMVLTDRVLTVKHSNVCQFFNLVVGNETVSGQALVDDLLSGRHYKDMRPLTMDPAVWQVYINQSKNVKEGLAKILLHALVFYELEVKRFATAQQIATQAQCNAPAPGPMPPLPYLPYSFPV